VWDQSFKLWTRRSGTNRRPEASPATKLIPPLLAWFEQGLLTVKREVGECLAVQAFKTKL